MIYCTRDNLYSFGKRVKKKSRADRYDEPCVESVIAKARREE